MSTFYYSTTELPIQHEMPLWMRDERYEYCDQVITRHHFFYSSLWKKIKKVFS